MIQRSQNMARLERFQALAQHQTHVLGLLSVTALLL